jgi:hypothetical protein
MLPYIDDFASPSRRTPADRLSTAWTASNSSSGRRRVRPVKIRRGWSAGARWALLLAATALLIAGCGDSDDDGGNTSPPPVSGNPPPPNSNMPPSGTTLTINGSPTGSVLVGSNYSFTPSTSAYNGATLTYSISNRPAWAQFNVSTGRLSGTPGAGHVGTYSDIVISVSDGSRTASIPSFSISVVATATGSATLSWLPPTQREDGTHLPVNELGGYRIYWGTSPNQLNQSVTLNGPGITTYVIEPLTPNTWYFAITALDASGIESTRSNVATKSIL